MRFAGVDEMPVALVVILPAHEAPLLDGPLKPSVLSQCVLESDIVQHSICRPSLQPNILPPQRCQIVSIDHFNPVILDMKLAKRGRAQPMGVTDLDLWNASVVIFKHPNDLVVV